jgi:Short C-terminal domain
MVGMAFIRKALFVATGGLLGLVFKDEAKDKRPAKAAEQRARPRKQTKQTKVARPKPKAAPRRKKATRTSTIARTSESRDGTIRELERLANLHAQGALSTEEFAAAKAKILGTGPKAPESGRDPERFTAVEANIAAARQLADLAADDRGAPVAPVGSG